MELHLRLYPETVRCLEITEHPGNVCVLRNAMCCFYQPSLISPQVSNSKLYSHLFVKRKNKFNVVLVYSMKVCWIIGVEFHSFCTSVLDEGDWYV